MIIVTHSAMKSNPYRRLHRRPVDFSVESQRRRGKRSGFVRRWGTALQHCRRPWKVAGISRTHFYRHGLHRLSAEQWLAASTMVNMNGTAYTSEAFNMICEMFSGIPRNIGNSENGTEPCVRVCIGIKDGILPKKYHAKYRAALKFILNAVKYRPRKPRKCPSPAQMRALRNSKYSVPLQPPIHFYQKLTYQMDHPEPFPA